MSEILQYIPGNSPLHHLNPVTKLLLVILIVGLCVMSAQVPFLCFLIGVLVLGALFSGLIKEIINQIPFLILLSFFLVILTCQMVQRRCHRYSPFCTLKCGELCVIVIFP